MARQERARRTKRRILEAAAGVFAEHGYASASMAEILSAAGVTKGALYFHFPGKEALAKAVVRWHFWRFVGAWEPQEGGGAGRRGIGGAEGGIQTVIDLAHDLARRLAEDPVTRGALRLAVEHGSFAEPDPAPYRMWIAGVARLLDEARGRGELRPDVDIGIASELLVGSFTGVQLVAQVLSGRTDLDAVMTGLWRVVLPGLAAESHLGGLKPEGTRGGDLSSVRRL